MTGARNRQRKLPALIRKHPRLKHPRLRRPRLKPLLLRLLLHKPAARKLVVRKLPRQPNSLLLRRLRQSSACLFAALRFE